VAARIGAGPRVEALHLDSEVQNFAVHRFYVRNRMIIASHHVKLSLVESELAPARDARGVRVPEG
jgi:hypothetical protein